MSELQLWLFYTLVPITGLLLLVMLVNAWLAPYELIHERLDKALADGALPTSQPARPVVAAYLAGLEGTSHFKLGDAACLWADIQPQQPITHPAAKAVFARLSSAVASGHLPSGGGLVRFMSAIQGAWWPTYDHPVSAIALRRYADREGNIPAFLQSVRVPEVTTSYEGCEKADDSGVAPRT